MYRIILFSTIQILCFLCVPSAGGEILREERLLKSIVGEGGQPRDLLINGVLQKDWNANLSTFVEDVDLSNLELKWLKANTFTKFVGLNDLNLSSNKLTSTKNVATAVNTVSPLKLNLSNNNLGSLSHDMPNIYEDTSYKQSKTFLLGGKYLWSIDLSNNSLHGIGIDFDVVYLDLSNNLLSCHGAIESRRFLRGEIYVANLNLSHNLINCQDAFFTLKINTLDMSYNDLQGLDADGLLRGLGLLTRLNLNHNNIRYIHPRAFEDTFFLQHLDLQFNQIRTIYKQVWSPLSFIRYIDLSSNRLEFLEWDNIRYLREPTITKYYILVHVKNNSVLRWSSLQGYFLFCGENADIMESICTAVGTISTGSYLPRAILCPIVGPMTVSSTFTAIMFFCETPYVIERTRCSR